MLGGPIILSTPGEANAEGKSFFGVVFFWTVTHPIYLLGFDGYLTNLTINGQIGGSLESHLSFNA